MNKIVSGTYTNDSLLRLEQIIGNTKKGIPAIIPVSASSWYAGIKKGIYPKPVKLGLRSSAWRKSEIIQLVNNGVAA